MSHSEQDMGSQPAGRQPVGRQPAGRHRHHKDHRVDLFADKLKNLKRERKLQNVSLQNELKWV